MENEKHECVIGLYHNYYEGSELVTLAELEDKITDVIMYNNALESGSFLKKCKYLRKKEWTLADYGDKRRATNMTRFDYCPECGKVIDWKAIRGMRHGEC